MTTDELRGKLQTAAEKTSTIIDIAKLSSEYHQMAVLLLVTVLTNQELILQALTGQATASAPEALKVCEDLVAWWESRDNPVGCYEMPLVAAARAVLEKAKLKETK